MSRTGIDRDDDQGVLEQVGHSFAFHLDRDVGDARRLGVEDEDVPQHQLQGVQVRTLQVDQGIEVGIPLEDAVHQRDHRDHRLGQREDHRPEEPQITAAVDLGSFGQFVGDRCPEVGPGDDHLPNGNRLRQHHRPPGVQHAEVLDHHVQRDQPALKEHREQHQCHDHVAAHELLSRQRVGDHDGQGGADQRADDRVDQRVDIPADDLLIAQQRLVAGGREVDRPQVDLTRRNRRRTGERAGQDVEQRRDHDDQRHRKQDVDRDQEDPVDRGLLDPPRLLGSRRWHRIVVRVSPRTQRGHHSPLPLSRLATALTSTSRITLITELNRPIAVARLKSAFSRPVL